MSFTYTKFKDELARGLDMSATDFRAALVMTNTTSDTEEDTDFLGDFTTLDECDGANYARQDLAGVSVTRDNANDLSFLDANDAVFTNLGAGTRQNQAVLVYVHVTNDADSFPAFFIDTGGFPFDGTGSNNTIQWSASGIAQVT